MMHEWSERVQIVMHDFVFNRLIQNIENGSIISGYSMLCDIMDLLSLLYVQINDLIQHGMCLCLVHELCLSSRFIMICFM